MNIKTDNPTPEQVGDIFESLQEIFGYIKNNLTSNIDAAGNLSVSQKNSLSSYVQDKDDLPYQIDRMSSGATQTYTGGTVIMDVSVGGYAIAQSFQRHPYYAGKSHKPEFTFEDLTPQVGVIKRVGYYSSSYIAPYDDGLDGFFLESDGFEIKIGVANSDTGSINYIPQSSWNIDTLDGSGDSGIVFDPSKFSICTTDFLYLGGSAIRFGLNLGGQIVWIHKYEHSNSIDGTIFSSPHQPLRWEIRSTGGTGTFKQICGDVSTEGSNDILGFPTSTPIFVNSVQASTPGVSYALAGIRLNNNAKGYKTNILKPNFSFAVTTNDNVAIEVWLNPTINGTVTWNDLDADDGVQYLEPDTTNNPSQNTLSGGVLLFSRFASSRNISDVSDVLTLIRRLGHSINGSSDELILSVKPLASGINADTYGAFNFNIY